MQNYGMKIYETFKMVDEYEIISPKRFSILYALSHDCLDQPNEPLSTDVTRYRLCRRLNEDWLRNPI